MDPADYPLLLEQLDRKGGIDAATRLYFAQKAFRHTARYEAAIAGYFAQVEARDGGYAVAESEDVFPYRLSLTFEKVQDLRYGENPHQRAAFYSDLGSTLYSVAAARKVQGKELSFNNILDLDAAWRLVTELHEPACVIIKHTNPCGTGLGRALRSRPTKRAWACDPTSAFGGIVAFNRKVDAATAKKIAGGVRGGGDRPGLRGRGQEGPGQEAQPAGHGHGHHRPSTRSSGFDLRRVMGGLLAQEWDLHRLERDKCEVVTKRKPTDEEWKALALAWTVVKHVKSNAIVFANAVQTVGVGAGQMSRVDSARFAALKAQLPLEGHRGGLRRVLPVPRRPRRGREGRGHRRHPARRLGEGRGGDRRRRRARPRHGLHRSAALPALTLSRRFRAPCRTFALTAFPPLASSGRDGSDRSARRGCGCGAWLGLARCRAPRPALASPTPDRTISRSRSATRPGRGRRPWPTSGASRCAS